MQVSLQGNTQGRQYFPTYTITEILPGQINLQYIIPDRQVYLSQREMLLIICLPVLQNGTAPFSTPCFFTYPFCSLDWSSQGRCLLMTTSFWMSITPPMLAKSFGNQKWEPASAHIGQSDSGRWTYSWQQRRPAIWLCCGNVTLGLLMCGMYCNEHGTSEGGGQNEKCRK